MADLRGMKKYSEDVQQQLEICPSTSPASDSHPKENAFFKFSYLVPSALEQL